MAKSTHTSDLFPETREMKDIVKYPQRNAEETNIFHIAGPR
jgi:hypothetical protein